MSTTTQLAATITALLIGLLIVVAIFRYVAEHGKHGRILREFDAMLLIKHALSNIHGEDLREFRDKEREDAIDYPLDHGGFIRSRPATRAEYRIFKALCMVFVRVVTDDRIATATIAIAIDNIVVYPNLEKGDTLPGHSSERRNTEIKNELGARVHTLINRAA